MRSHLPDHPQMYVPIGLRCNREIMYTHHMRVHTTMKVLGRHQGALAKVSKFPESVVLQTFLDRINFHQSFNYTAICCIFPQPLTYIHAYIHTLFYQIVFLISAKFPSE